MNNNEKSVKNYKKSGTLKKNVFMVMPFEDKLANELYRLSTKDICKSFNLEIKRADELFTTNPILDDIISAIEKSIITIVDISGNNPNVFYELGMAHILKQNQTIIITHDEYANVPSDITHFRIIKYEDKIVGKKEYEDKLRKTIEPLAQDFKLIYMEEYKIAMELISSFDRAIDIYMLIALSKLPTPPNRNEPYHIEGHNEKTLGKQSGVGISIEDDLESYEKIGFIEFAGDKILLTPKGKAFVELAEEKGYILDYANETTYTKGHVPSGDYQNDYKKISKSSA